MTSRPVGMWSASCVLAFAVSGVGYQPEPGNNCIQVTQTIQNGRHVSAHCIECTRGYYAMGSSYYGDCCSRGCSACDRVQGSKQEYSKNHYESYMVKKYDGCNKDGCKSGFTLNSYGRCEACADSCENCASKGPRKCDPGGCQRGYKNGDSKKPCVACPPKCGKCDKAAEGECESGECDSGYGNVLEAQNGTKAACEPCKVPDCNRCPSASADTCEECNDENASIGVNLETGQCDECYEGCDSCVTTKRNGCTTCEDGYTFERRVSDEKGVRGECVAKGGFWLLVGVGVILVIAIVLGVYFFKVSHDAKKLSRETGGDNTLMAPVVALSGGGEGHGDGSGGQMELTSSVQQTSFLNAT